MDAEIMAKPTTHVPTEGLEFSYTLTPISIGQPSTCNDEHDQSSQYPALSRKLTEAQ